MSKASPVILDSKSPYTACGTQWWPPADCRCRKMYRDAPWGRVRRSSHGDVATAADARIACPAGTSARSHPLTAVGLSLRSPRMFAGIPGAFEQLFGVLFGPVPRLSFLAFLALQCAQFHLSVRRDSCRPFQSLALMAGFGFGGLQPAKLFGMLRREFGQSFQFLALGSSLRLWADNSGIGLPKIAWANSQASLGAASCGSSVRYVRKLRFTSCSSLHKKRTRSRSAPLRRKTSYGPFGYSLSASSSSDTPITRGDRVQQCLAERG